MVTNERSKYVAIFFFVFIQLISVGKVLLTLMSG